MEGKGPSKRAQILLETLEEYFGKTSIHVLQYFSLRDACCERLIWFMVVTASVTFASMILHDTVLDWQGRHVQTTVDTIAYPIQQVPFPSVTVCSPGLDHWNFIQRQSDFLFFGILSMAMTLSLGC